MLCLLPGKAGLAPRSKKQWQPFSRYPTAVDTASAGGALKYDTWSEGTSQTMRKRWISSRGMEYCGIVLCSALGLTRKPSEPPLSSSSHGHDYRYCTPCHPDHLLPAVGTNATSTLRDSKGDWQSCMIGGRAGWSRKVCS